jgi:hypothetical protein
MNIVAYCDRRYEQATRGAVGGSALLLTCPPASGADLARYAPEIAQADLIYFNLHGVPGRAEWYTSERQVALTAAQLRALDLTRATVYLVNCYAGGGLLDVLKELKPRAIIGGFGENLGGLERLAGADLLGLWFRRWLALGLTPAASLKAAKTRLRLSAQMPSVQDALHFEVLYERDL